MSDRQIFDTTRQAIANGDYERARRGIDMLRQSENPKARQAADRLEDSLPAQPSRARSGSLGCLSTGFAALGILGLPITVLIVLDEMSYGAGILTAWSAGSALVTITLLVLAYGLRKLK